jgi:hypothetical protein
MFKNLTKEYFTYLLYKAISLAFMVVALNFFVLENAIVGNVIVNALFFVISIIFTMMYSKLKPPLAECLNKCKFWVSFIITTGNTIAFMGSILFIAYFLSGKDVEIKILMYLLLMGALFSAAYFFQCKKCSQNL